MIALGASFTSAAGNVRVHALNNMLLVPTSVSHSVIRVVNDNVGPTP